MQIRFFLFSLFFAVLSPSAHAADDGKIPFPGGKCSMFRVELKDKSGTPYSLRKPKEFLSERSIERRKRQGLKLDSTDLPVSPRYVEAIKARGVSVVGTSKWNNTVLVRTSDDYVADVLRLLPFVKKVTKVLAAPDSVMPPVRNIVAESLAKADTMKVGLYGHADKQIDVVNGKPLHEAGFRGKGMMIAVLDGGFMNVDKIPCMQKIDIVATKVIGQPSFGTVCDALDHGTCVLSLMAVDEPGIYVGTAPEASYVLVKTEVGQYEQMVEEDFWAMGAEYADSIGADLINSSLGYNLYDVKEQSHKYSELDGKTSLISRTASMLASKGIIHCNSAGNAGNDPWKKIGVPADADDILAVGALTPKKMNANFSSVGPSADGRVKPDIMAPGNPTAVVNGRGNISYGSGTSFASPLLCGMVACLWQALPGKTACEIMDLVRMTGDRANEPDNIFGHGIADFGKAYQYGK